MAGLALAGGPSNNPYSEGYQGFGKYKKSSAWQPMFSGGNYNAGGGVGGGSEALNDLWSKWNEAYKSPGFGEETITGMRNAAETSARSGWDNQLQSLQNQLGDRGLSGGGFADAQIAALQNQQWGGLQDVLGNVDIEAAKAANQNKMDLLGQGMNLAGMQLQAGQNAYDAQLARDQFAYQQWQDYLDRKAAAQDRYRSNQLYDYMLSQYR